MAHGHEFEGNGRSIVVVGAGGHAKVVIECLRNAGWEIIGCTAADPSGGPCVGVPVIGTDDILPGLRDNGVEFAFCALGNNALRDRVGDRLQGMGFVLPPVVGPGSRLSPSVSIGYGAAILPGAVINAESAIGDLAIINTNANIDHDARIGRCAHIGPGVALAGEVEVGDRTFIATGAAVIPQRRIGPDSLIGAGSVVVHDLPGKVVAFGNPARIQRKI